MSKFNRGRQRTRVHSPVQTSSMHTGRTHNLAPAYSKDPKSQLFLQTIGSFFGESTFYQFDRDQEFKTLVRAVALTVTDDDDENMEWLKGLVKWARHSANIRTAPMVIALEAVKARLDAGLTGMTNLPNHHRQIIYNSFGRDDEPGEAIAYWVSNYGKNLPMPLKRAVADYLSYNSSLYGYLKYGRTGTFKFRDLIRLTHPKPRGLVQNNSFKYILEKEDAPVPKKIELRNRLLNLPVEERRNVSAEELKSAGFTWEQYAGWIQGDLDWEKIIPSMGYMALLRNLRNFEEAGIKSDYVRNKLRDPREVARSKQLPFRFLSAYRELRDFFYMEAVQAGLDYSVQNIPTLKGNTLILVDQSGSMTWHMSKHSKANYQHTAAIFGAALAKSCENPATLVQFGTHAIEIPRRTWRTKPILRVVSEDFHDMGGTRLHDAIDQFFNDTYDRVVIITDEQATGSVDVPSSVPVYVWNVVGYRHGIKTGDNVHTLGGLSDNSFKLINLLEMGKDAKWPWEYDGSGNHNASQD